MTLEEMMTENGQKLVLAQHFTGFCPQISGTLIISLRNRGAQNTLVLAGRLKQKPTVYISNVKLCGELH